MRRGDRGDRGEQGEGRGATRDAPAPTPYMDTAEVDKDGMPACYVGLAGGGSVNDLAAVVSVMNCEMRDRSEMTSGMPARLPSYHPLPARSNCPPWQHGQSAPLGSAPARPLCPLRARLAALGRLSTPRVRPSHGAPSHRLGGPSKLPPKLPISPPFDHPGRPVLQAGPQRGAAPERYEGADGGSASAKIKCRRCHSSLARSPAADSIATWLCYRSG